MGCSSRGYKPIADFDLQNDMNSEVFHDQITQYVDVFDVYGHYDINPGRVCTYGTSDQMKRPARQYFEAIVGYPGSVLTGAGQVLSGIDVDKITGVSPKVAVDFSTSRYYTHFAWGLGQNLLTQPGYLAEDGTTD